jgi:hypothetical protein
VSVAAPAPERVELRGEAPELGAISRARNVVDTLGGRFSLELGIDLDGGPEEIERWALVATLFGDGIEAPVVLHACGVLEQAGVRAVAEAGDKTREELTMLLESGGRAPSEELMATRLQTLGAFLTDRYDGRLATFGGGLTNPVELERALQTLPGWGSVTVRTFLRELRGVWPGADPTLDERAAAGARHLRLPTALDELRSIARAAHLDFRDLEVGLVRLELSHDLDVCPGGWECPFAGSEHTRFHRY